MCVNKKDNMKLWTIQDQEAYKLLRKNGILHANEELGDVGDFGVLGKGTGFNGAYDKNGKRAGTYTRTDTKSTTWTRK